MHIKISENPNLPTQRATAQNLKFSHDIKLPMPNFAGKGLEIADGKFPKSAESGPKAGDKKTCAPQP